MLLLSLPQGWYSVVAESFYSERELVDGLAPTGAAVEWVQEESYFFRLSRCTERLRAHFASHPSFVVPASRQREMVRLLEGGGEGLQDISVSRTSCSWGLRVPGHQGSSSSSSLDHTVYVWLDALVNYMSALDAPVHGRGQEGVCERQHYWPPDVHVVGKDILYFHSVLWPALLMAVGQELPKRIVAHGW
jgi:methionyl-tRNA synthetase